MRVRNGDTPIQLPEIVRAGDAITARWANGMRSALQRLRDRTPVAYGSQSSNAYNHPWKISTKTVSSELRIYVSHGVVTFQKWDGTDSPTYGEADVYFNATTPTILQNDPFLTGTVGYFVAAASTDYGVWLKLQRNLGGFDNPNASSEPYSELVYEGFITSCEILVSSTFVEKFSTPTFDDDFAHVYLGKVSVNAESVPTITQYRRSDVMTGIVAWPTNFTIVSGDAGNSLTTGSDNGAFYDAPPIVSADANNSISAGSDGGAFYDAP